MRSEVEYEREMQFEIVEDQWNRLLEFSNDMRCGYKPPIHTHVDAGSLVGLLHKLCPGVDPEALLVWDEAAEEWRINGTVPDNLSSIKMRARAVMLTLLDAARRNRRTKQDDPPESANNANNGKKSVRSFLKNDEARDLWSELEERNAKDGEYSAIAREFFGEQEVNIKSLLSQITRAKRLAKNQ